MFSRLALAAGLVAVVFAASAGPLVGAGSRGDSFPGRNGEIVFSVGGRHYYDLYLMRPDGRNARRITRGRGWERYPGWSPDGKWIAYVSDRSRPGHAGADEIYVMRANGSGLRRVTRDRFGDDQLAWAPDGKQFVFSSFRPFATSALCVMNVDGSGFRRVARNGELPAWSPDGRTIAFVRPNGTFTSEAIWQMNPDGSNQRQLTFPPENPGSETYGHDTMPEWSPDGKQIAFMRRYRNRQDIYLIRLDGTRLRRLTKSSGRHIWPAWSPNGKRIAFVTISYRKKAIDAINADGTREKRLSTGLGDYLYLDWQPLPSR